MRGQVNNQYLCFFLLSLCFCTSLFSIEKDELSIHYQNPENAQGSLPKAGSFMGINGNVPSQFLPGTLLYPQNRMNLKDLLGTRTNYVEAQEVNPYIKRNEVTLTEESFAYILNSRPMSSPVLSFEFKPSFSLGMSDDCPVQSFSLLDAFNNKAVTEIENTLDEINSRTQYCGFEIEGVEPIHASINFCQCVKQRTVNFGENEDVIYPVMKDNKVFVEAVGAFKQQFVDLVISEVFQDLEGMTKKANAFLSTEELAPVLFGKMEDAKNNITVDFSETRRMVHGCSGVAMKDMISEMFTPDEYGVALCDAGSANNLLEAIKKYSSCGGDSESECDNLATFAENEHYKDESPEKVISDLMTFQFSKNLIKPDALFARVAGDASPMDKYKMSLSLASSMSDFDGDNRILVRDQISMRSSLPKDSQLEMLGELIQQVDKNKDFDLSVYPEETVRALIRTLRTNPLLKEDEYSFQADEHDKNKAWVKDYVNSLISDRELRIKENPKFSLYFKNENPLEAARVLVINNYIQKSEDLGLRCEAVKDKVRNLCSSISGNGVALFSHPDFRRHAPSFITEGKLHQEINDITSSESKRNPVVDQLFCHANFASLSNDCQEAMRAKTDAQAMFSHCSYDSSWLLKHIDKSLASGAQGNVEEAVMKTQETVSRVYEERLSNKSTASSSAFVSMVSSNGEVVSGYGKDSPRSSYSKILNKGAIGVSSISEMSSVPLPRPVTSDSSDKADKLAPSSTFSFSDDFVTNSPANKLAPVTNIVPPSFSVPTPVVQNIPSNSQANEILLNELRASEESQRRFRDEISKLKSVANTKKDSSETEELKKKEQEVSRLDERVKDLRAEVERKRENNPGPVARVSPQSSSFARPSPTPTPTPNNQIQKSSVVSGPSSSSTGVSPSSPSAISPSSGVSRAPASIASPGTAASNISLTNIQQKVFPRESSLSQVARVLNGSNYILRDIGIPGKAEKIVFKLKDGEVLYVDGEPQIAFVEVIDLENVDSTVADELIVEAEKDAVDELDEIEQPERSSMARRLQWDEVIEMIESHVTK